MPFVFIIFMISSAAYVFACLYETLLFSNDYISVCLMVIWFISFVTTLIFWLEDHYNNYEVKEK